MDAIFSCLTRADKKRKNEIKICSSVVYGNTIDLQPHLYLTAAWSMLTTPLATTKQRQELLFRESVKTLGSTIL